MFEKVNDGIQKIIEESSVKMIENSVQVCVNED